MFRSAKRVALNRLTACAICLMVLIDASTAHAADFQKGVEAHKRGDFKTVLKEWGPLAEQGNASAQYNLAQMYRRGVGIERNDKTALMWFKRAAELGHPKAQWVAARMYANGDGAPKNVPESAKWAKLAARQGVAEAQVYMGNLYAQGTSVPQDYVAAYAWFSLAAAQGDKDARHNMKVVRAQMTPADVQRATQLSELATVTVGTVDPGAKGAKSKARQYTVADGETLWYIADRLKPASDVTVYQMLRAILKANPQLPGAGAKLEAGKKLRLPGLQQITEVDAVQAKAEILGKLSP